MAAALGADDFFVAVDKFKNARIDNPAGSTEDIAQSALPSAGLAMFLTTCTTMAAFFSMHLSCHHNLLLCCILWSLDNIQLHLGNFIRIPRPLSL